MELISDLHPIIYSDNVYASASSNKKTEIFSIVYKADIRQEDFDTIERQFIKTLKSELKKDWPIIILECTGDRYGRFINIELYRQVDKEYTTFGIRQKSKEEGSFELQTLDKVVKLTDNYLKELSNNS